MDSKKVVFPASFVWGTATSAAQSEGGMEHSDWRIRERKGMAPASGKACDKRHRYDEDFLRLAELGLRHHRTSLEWSRIEPQKGVYDREAIDDYRMMMEAAHSRGITLWITLHHVTLPAWFARMGGFMDESIITYWHRFVEFVAKELGTCADYWIPVHAPAAYAAGAYLLGIYPPAKTRMDKFMDMLPRIHQVHGDTYRILKAYLPSRAKVGMSALLIPVQRADPDSDQDRISADFVDTFMNRVPLDALREGVIKVPGRGAVELPSCRGAADFMGIDYFFRLVVGKSAARVNHNFLDVLGRMEGMAPVAAFREGEVITETGVGAFAPGIYQAIKMVQHSGLSLPIYITASGVATSDEQFRIQYLSRCLGQVASAIEQGLDVRGYFHWSDVDTYEWNKGYDAHYGLCGFDPLTLERRPRPAAGFLSAVARTGKLQAAPAPGKNKERKRGRKS